MKNLKMKFYIDMRERRGGMENGKMKFAKNELWHIPPTVSWGLPPLPVETRYFKDLSVLRETKRSTLSKFT